MKDNVVSICAIVCISVLEAIALLEGLDGAIFSMVVAVIGGIAGYKIKGIVDKIVDKRRK
jgi:hypothetical protein